MSDHFSAVAGTYAEFRPTYPAELFQWLASVVPANDLALDCGSGSGQAAVDLCRHFAQVISGDASVQQLRHAPLADNLHRAATSAEAMALRARTCDLVTVAQAVHWFDLPRFYTEARRVLRVSGVLAIWSYRLLRVDSDVDEIIREFYEDTVGSYWPPERKLVDAGLHTLEFPFEVIQAPDFAMTAQWNLHSLLGYVSTWSAVSRFRQGNSADPVQLLREKLAPVWRADEIRRVEWPLDLLAGRNVSQRFQDPLLS